MSELATFVSIDNIVNSWRQRLLFFIDTTVWGRIWDAVDFALNAALCIVYVVNTTVVDAKNEPLRIPAANRCAEFLVAVVFLAQYIARYVVINANHRAFEHLVVFFAFVSPITAFAMSMHSAAVRDSYMSAGVMAIFYPARFLRLHYAIKRVLAMLASSARWLRLTLIRREAASLGSDIVVAILFFASVVHSGIYWYSQNNDIAFNGFDFLDAIYFISSKFGLHVALGSDDSIPRSVFSELISMAIVGLIAFAVPSRVTRLVDLAIKTSAYTKTIALPAASRHALVCGAIELDSIRQFLHEFFNADHGPNIFRTTIVVLHPDEPTLEMKALLQDPAYANRVFYVKGRATSFKALKRARVDLASCVYILSRKYSRGTGIEEDAETVLIALSLSAFNSSASTASSLQSHPSSSPSLSLSLHGSGTEKHHSHQGADSPMVHQPKFQVFAQTILPGSMSHMSYLQTSRVLCVDEMRMGIMAQNSATPGFATLAFMLSKTVGDHSGWDLTGVFAESLAQSEDDGWVKTYMHGISQEIYQAHVPSSLAGKSFFKATRYFYRCHGLLIFGVGSLSTNKTAPHKRTMGFHPSLEPAGSNYYYQVILSPRNYVLQKHDMLFAISTDIQSVLDAMMYSERVSIRSTRIRRLSRQEPTKPDDYAGKSAKVEYIDADADVDVDVGATTPEVDGAGAIEHQTIAATTPGGSPFSARFSLFSMFGGGGGTATGAHRQPTADHLTRLTVPPPQQQQQQQQQQQVGSPRRMVVRTPGGGSRRSRCRRQPNYLSDSDSSYFSPAHNKSNMARGSDTDTPEAEPAAAASAIATADRTRIRRAARRRNVVPETTANHIVVCDASDGFPRNIELLVRALKNAFEDDDLAVVILSPGEIDAERSRAMLRDFANLYLVRGTPLSQPDLRRTRIECAQRAIVLGNSSVRQTATPAATTSTSTAAMGGADASAGGDST
ncbi:hypothetical protein H4S06_002777, partial [Coemansia sp. BCRC 34490]